MSPYNYKPLPNNKIRILTLHPGTLNDPIIKARIDHVDLNTEPEFSAISYQWESRDLCQKIQIIETEETGDEKYLDITSSLYNVLLHLRRDEEEVCLWADAICINQNDTDERNKQILLMGEIYRSATDVIVYVGSETKEIQLGLDLAIQLFDHITTHAKTGEFGLDHEFSQSNDDRLIELGFPVSADPAWAALRSIIHLGWTKRAWMLQEAVLNSNTNIRCGTVEFPIELILIISQTARFHKLPNVILHDQYATDKDTDTDTELDRRAVGNLLFIEIIRRALWFSKTENTGPTLHFLLHWSIGFHCEDQRDKVYCLLGTAIDATRYGIEPDYSRSLRDVYIDVAVRMLQHSTTLDLLTSVGTRRSTSLLNLPSWVPDWSTDNDEWNGRHKPFLLDAFESEQMDSLNCYQASRDMVSELEFSPDQTQLTSSAVFIDTLSYITDSLTHVDDQTKYVEWLESKSKELGNSSRYGHETFTALWKTLTGQRHDFEKDEGVFRAWWNMYRPGTYPDTFVNDDILEKYPDSETRRFVVDLFGGGITEHVVTRKFSITKDGNFCLVPMHAQEGDTIVLLKGGRTLYVVRNEGDGYLLVGEAYVHGLMNGEALENDSKFEADFRNIKLK